MAAVTTDVARLKRVFELELERGCDNATVIGGLDRMLIQMAEDGLLAIGGPLRPRVKELPNGGYRSLDGERRRDWLTGTIRALSEPGRPVHGPPSRGRANGTKAAASARVASVRPEAPRNRLELGSPVSRLPGVGKAAENRLAKLGVNTAADAAYFFPRRHNDFTDMRRIADVRPSNDPQTVVGTVFAVREMRYGRRVKGSEAVINDGSGALRVVWFNMPYVARGLEEGSKIVVSGRVRAFRGRLQMENPEYEELDAELMHTGRLVPVYPATQGLAQRTIRRAVKTAVDELADRVVDPVPAWLRDGQRLPPLGEAIRAYHYPQSLVAAEEARQRIALGEFVAIQAAVLMRRAEWQQGNDAPSLSFGDRLQPFLRSLPFALTRSQDNCLDEILRDIRGPRPMLRLLQGDVGSGKTVVAFAAMLAAVKSGHQAALMAPTEILAEQHYRSLARALGGHEMSALDGVFAPSWLGRPLRVLLLTGSLTPNQK